MNIDDSFFGLARSGVIQDVFTYPCIMRSADKDHLNRAGGSFYVMGEETTPDNTVRSGYAGLNPVSQVRVSDDIVVIPDGAELIQRPRNLIRRLNETRSQWGFSKLIYLQGVADPYIMPVLVYAGVSLFDDSTIRMESNRRIRYTPFGRQLSDTNEYEHNIEFADEIIETLRASIRNGTLREIVEKYQISSKALEILRVLDSDEGGEIELTFPRRTGYIKANSLESLRRPDLTRYRSYIEKDYRKPFHRQIALLLPCSARKPYSSSKSHRRIFDALGRLRRFTHEIIVTSPVGVVPRELEQTYPAAFYDIPVIGEWYEDEKMMIKSMLTSFFHNNAYESVVAFVTEDLAFIEESLPGESRMIIWDKSGNNFEELRNAITGAAKERTAEPGKINVRMENFHQIAAYQFGSWISPYLEGCKIVRSYNNDMLVKDGRPFLVYNDRLGKFTINKNSAQWFVDNGKFLVEIDDFKPTANVYAVGVLETTNDIRQEDEVVLHHGGTVKGVGTAKMPLRAMLDLKKGVAVKVRN